MTPKPNRASGCQRFRAGRFLSALQARPLRPARLLLFLAWAAVLAVMVLAAWSTLFPARPAVRHVTAQAPVRSAFLGEEPGGRMSINDASEEDLQCVSGIGPALARAIVETREELGGFRFIEELLNVPGVGRKRLDALAQYFYCPFEP